LQPGEVDAQAGEGSGVMRVVLGDGAPGFGGLGVFALLFEGEGVGGGLREGGGDEDRVDGEPAARLKSCPSRSRFWEDLVRNL
jgi:hypothetical protein